MTSAALSDRRSWKRDLARYLEIDRARSLRRVGYRAHRNPLLMLFVGPSLVFLFERRFPQRGMSRRILGSRLDALRLKLWDEERCCLVRYPRASAPRRARAREPALACSPRSRAGG